MKCSKASWRSCFGPKRRAWKTGLTSRLAYSLWSNSTKRRGYDATRHVRISEAFSTDVTKLLMCRGTKLWEALALTKRFL